MKIDQFDISSVTSDSREVAKGSAFVAIRGSSQDGHDFIEEAQRKGAVVVYAEKKPKQRLSIPVVIVPNTRDTLARIAANFYQNPSHFMKMIAVTGTSGKTTTTYLIESILAEAGYRVGVIGTNNFRFGKKVFPSTHTTPGPVELQKLLAEMRNEGCSAVVMEVSSHALVHCRADYIAFDIAVFKNLTAEHLDFHLNMEEYYQSKKLLFTRLLAQSRAAGKSPVAIVNQDDSYGQRLIAELAKEKTECEPYSLTSGGVQVSVEGIQGNILGLSLQSPLVGLFNAYNVAAAVAVGQALKISPQLLRDGIKKVNEVPGRLQRISSSHGPHVFVDYAHKPDALEKVLEALNRLKGKGRMITVFGCGGDRDRTKRSKMGKIAAECSEQVIVTSDNPRTEDPQEIIREILVGTQGFSHVLVEPDRRKAIFKAIELSQQGDIVLIAGKGHEDYQIVGKEKKHFDDREVAAQALTSRFKSL